MAQGSVETVGENVLELLCLLLQKQFRDIVWVLSFLSANTVECFLNAEALISLSRVMSCQACGGVVLRVAIIPSTETQIITVFLPLLTPLALYRPQHLRQMMEWSEEVMQSHESPLLGYIPTCKTPASLMLSRLSAVLVPNKHTGRHGHNDADVGETKEDAPHSGEKRTTSLSSANIPKALERSLITP